VAAQEAQRWIRVKESLLAGTFSGISGLIVFLIIHYFWIMPIWFILPFGLVNAGLGGLVAGWAYGEFLPKLPPRPWRVLSIVGFISGILLPSLLLAEVWEPIFDLNGPSALLMMSVGQAAAIFILELVVTATLIGGLAGWIICRTHRASLATLLQVSTLLSGRDIMSPFEAIQQEL
jgi:hypothetical protein